MAIGWTGTIRSEGKAKVRRPAEATTKPSGLWVALLPNWGPQAGIGPGEKELRGGRQASGWRPHWLRLREGLCVCYAVSQEPWTNSCLLMVAWVRGRDQEDVTSSVDLSLLFGSSSRSLKATVFASVLGTVTCVERLSFFLLLRPKKGTWGILPGVTWMLRQPVCLLSASPYLQAMFCSCPKLPNAWQGWGAASGGLGWAENPQKSHQLFYRWGN